MGDPKDTITAAEQAELDNWFTYHPPTDLTKEQYAFVRAHSKQLAEYVIRNVKNSADRTAALRSLRGTVMAINLAIACNP